MPARPHLVNLVGGPEPVKEVHDGHAARQRGKVRHQGHVVRFLHAVAAQQGPPGLAHSHHILRGREESNAMMPCVALTQWACV